jgi:cytochrome c-type protein NapC
MSGIEPGWSAPAELRDRHSHHTPDADRLSRYLASVKETQP